MSNETKSVKNLSQNKPHEWLTEEDKGLLWEEAGVDLGYDIYWINALLTRKYGDPATPPSNRQRNERTDR